MAFASGTSAVFSAIVNLARQGDEIVSANNLYGGTFTLFNDILPQFGITTRFVKPNDLEGMEAAVTERTRAIYVEAIGNPLGELTFTMTAGYISALDREITPDRTPINMLQTDAAINSGNSGGPLFDMNGNIIGVTTAKVSGTTDSGVSIEGLGFAIPINDVLRVVYDLQQYGRVRGRAYLGVTLQNLDAEVAEIYSLPSGPQVVTVTEGSCSEKAGLQPHDIILEFDGREINTYSDLVSALSKRRAGDTVKMKLYRAGAEIEVTLTLDERPGEEEIDKAEQQAQSELEGQSQPDEEFTVPDFDGYGG